MCKILTILIQQSAGGKRIEKLRGRTSRRSGGMWVGKGEDWLEGVGDMINKGGGGGGKRGGRGKERVNMERPSWEQKLRVKGRSGIHS
jgi:hypothetical protein